MSRDLTNSSLTGRNIYNQSSTTIASSVNDIKEKIDFDADIGLGNLLIGNDSNGYTSNTLTAGTNVSITNSSGNITIASTNTDSNFFEKTNNDIRAENTTDNLLLGTTSNSDSRKLKVSGSIEGTLVYGYSFITNVGLLDSSLNSVLSIGTVGIYQINSSSANRVVKIQSGSYNHEFPTVSANDKFVLENAAQVLTNKEINKITNSSDRTIFEYNSTFSRLFLGNTTDNIQMFNAFLVSPKIEDASLNNFYNIVPSELSANVDITLPVLSSGDEFVFKNATQTLTNKSISYSQITSQPTIPTNNNQLTNGAGFITASSTDTLSNKTIVAPFLDTFRNSNNRFTISYSDTTNSLTFGNSTDTSSAINFTLSSPAINTAVSGTAILDEDDLNSNSATKLATQQSIKSYVDTLKTKYDFTTTVSNGKLLIGNSAGNYSVNNLTAGTGIAITNTSGNISIANTATDTNFFQKSGNEISALNTTDNFLLGTATNSNSRKLLVNGTAEITGKLTLGSTINDLTLPTGTDTFCLLNATQTLTNKTLTNANLVLPNISRLVGGGFSMLNVFNSIITLGNSTDTSEIMNGIATNMILTTPKIQDTSSNHTYNFTVSELTANRNILLPNLTDNDTFCFENQSQTLKFKSFENPKIFDSNSINRYEITSSNISANREINLPVLTANDTFVFALHSQSLTNKNLTSATNTFPTLNQDTTGNSATATKIASITNTNIVQLTSTQTLTNKTLTTPTISSIANNTFGIDVSSPRATLDLARNYPNDTSSTSGEATNIFLNTINSSGASSGLVWKPNFSGYSKTSAFINFIPSGNFFRGHLEFGANNTADNSSAARKVMEIRDSGQHLFGNPITWSPEVIGNNWYPLCYWDGNASSAIAGANTLNVNGNLRKYVWSIESSSGSFRALGLAANNTDSITDTTGTNFTSIGWFNPTSKSTQFSFTASHRCYSENTELYEDDKIGLIVCSTGKYDSLYSDKISVENAVPIVELSNKRKCKSVLGVIGKYETEDEKRVGFDFGWIPVYEKDKNRLYINSIGEGGLWVCNTNGDLENGDYVQSSSVAGYGEKQDDDFLHNYSVAKITCDVDFGNIQEGFEIRILAGDVIAVFVGCIYQQG